MLLVHNRTGLILGLIGIFVGMVAAALTGWLGVGGLTLAAIWFGGGLWWKYRPRPDGLPGRYPSIYFIPLPFLAVPVVLLSMVALVLDARDARGTARKAPTGERAAAPEAGPPAQPPLPEDADPVDRALYVLASAKSFRWSGALLGLSRLDPQPARRDEVVAAVRPILDADDKTNASYAVAALAHWGTPEQVIPILIEKSRDDDHGVRAKAIEALGRYQEPEAVRTLAQRLVEDSTVSVDAVRALRAQGPAAEPALLPLLAATDDPMTALRIFEVLQDVGGRDSLEVLRPFTEWEHPTVPLHAEGTMRKISARLANAAPSDATSP
jgi:hypothetical protein